MRSKIILAFFVALAATTIGRAEDRAPVRLPLQVDGPLKVSPFITQPAANPNKDHYIYSVPTPCYYFGWYGWSGWCSYSPYPCGFSTAGPVQGVLTSDGYSRW